MKRVLIIEDNEETISNLESEFKNSGIDAVCCSDYENAEIAINNNIYDAVILDWYFVLPDSNQISIRILQQLKESHFVPVFVYTGQLTDFENKTEEELQYPKNLIRGFGKESITPENLKKEIQSLIERNLALKISMAYRSRIHHHLEKIFFELNDSENNALGNILKTIYGDGDNIDWNNDIILTLLHRSIISDDEFTKKIKDILVSVNIQDNNREFNRKILNKILYHHGKSDYVRNGDIVTIKDASNNNTLAYGIVVTPDCDLENKSCRQIQIIEVRKLDDNTLGLNNDMRTQIRKYSHQSLFSLPSIYTDNGLTDFVAVLKHKIIVHEKDIDNGPSFPKSSRRFQYSHTYILNAQDVKMNLICSIVNPYKAEFLQKLHTNNSRVGIPDIKDLL